MMASIQTKIALIKILAIRPIVTKFDRMYYRDIQKYQAGIKAAVLANDKDSIALYRKEIQKKRKALRMMRDQIYIFDVYIKKYKMNRRVELSFQNGAGREQYKKLLKSAVDEAIHGIRAELKAGTKPLVYPFGRKWAFLKLGTKEKGLVFADEGSVLKAHVQKNMKMLLDGKTPTAPRRYVGIELEFCAPIKEEQLAVKLFKNGIHKFAQLKQDGSLRPKDNEHSFELALLLEETMYKRDLKKVTNILNEVKAVAKDRRCGLHVHIDMRRRDKDLVYNNLVACQYALLAVVDPNRYNNEFCRVVSGRKFPTEFTGDRVERYKTINAAAYPKYRTLEVRMHEGSVSFNEISNWVDLLLKVANYSKYLKTDVTKLPMLKSRLKLKDKLYNYALERSHSWQIQNNPNARNMREDAADLLIRPIRAREQNAGVQPPNLFINRIDEVLNNVVNDIPPVIRFEPIAEGPVAVQAGNELRLPDLNDAAFRLAYIAQEEMPEMPEENVDFDNDLMDDEDGN